MEEPTDKPTPEEQVPPQPPPAQDAASQGAPAPGPDASGGAQGPPPQDAPGQAPPVPPPPQQPPQETPGQFQQGPVPPGQAPPGYPPPGQVPPGGQYGYAQPPYGQPPYGQYPPSAYPYPQGPLPDERTMATLAHVLILFGGCIGPLIIYFIKRDQSKFVAFHALQALTWTLIQMVFWMVVMGVWMVWFVAMIPGMAQSGPSAEPPPAFFATMFAIYPISLCMWVLNLTLAIVYGIKANKGEWAQYPIIGAWARKWAGV